MSILENMRKAHKKARLAARKHKGYPDGDLAEIEKNTLTTIIGELDTRIKNGDVITDKEVVSAIKKTTGTIEDNIEHAVKQGIDITNLGELKKEVEILHSFLPAQMSDKALEEAVVAAMEAVGATSMKDMGKVMGILNKDHAGLFDGGKASSIVRGKLS